MIMERESHIIETTKNLSFDGFVDQLAKQDVQTESTNEKEKERLRLIILGKLFPIVSNTEKELLIKWAHELGTLLEECRKIKCISCEGRFGIPRFLTAGGMCLCSWCIARVNDKNSTLSIGSRYFTSKIREAKTREEIMDALELRDRQFIRLGYKWQPIKEMILEWDMKH